MTLAIAVYVIGFAVTCGVFSAMWGDEYQPGQVGAAIIWPVFVPIYLTMKLTHRVMDANERRRKELERERREQERLLREAGIE